MGMSFTGRVLKYDYTQIMYHIDFSDFMVFNATFNNISVLSWQSVFLWRKPECPEKTTLIT